MQNDTAKMLKANVQCKISNKWQMKPGYSLEKSGNTFKASLRHFPQPSCLQGREPTIYIHSRTIWDTVERKVFLLSTEPNIYIFWETISGTIFLYADYIPHFDCTSYIALWHHHTNQQTRNDSL